MEHIAFEVEAQISEVTSFVKSYVNSGQGAPRLASVVQSVSADPWKTSLHIGQDMPSVIDEESETLFPGESLRIRMLRFIGGITELLLDFEPDDEIVEPIMGLLNSMTKRWPALGQELLGIYVRWSAALGIETSIPPERLAKLASRSDLERQVVWGHDQVRDRWLPSFHYTAAEEAEALYQAIVDAWVNTRFCTSMRYGRHGRLTGPWDTAIVQPAQTLPVTQRSDRDGLWFDVAVWLEAGEPTLRSLFSIDVAVQVFSPDGQLVPALPAARLEIVPMGPSQSEITVLVRESDQQHALGMIIPFAHRLGQDWFLTDVWREITRHLALRAQERQDNSANWAEQFKQDMQAGLSETIRQAIGDAAHELGAHGAPPATTVRYPTEAERSRLRMPEVGSKRYEDWETIWAFAAPLSRRGTTRVAILARMPANLPDLACSDSTLARILHAGSQGFLRRPVIKTD